jgi:serine/threonine protein kinase
MALQEGQNLGAYRVLAQLGQGGMATVYKAYHPKLDRYVAIKMVHQAFLEDPAFVTRFEREAQIVASLDHPHIVPVFDFAEHNGQPYLVMKYIEGSTLKAQLSKGALPLERIIPLMTDIADALDYAHKRGVLHRDIKPSNIVIDTNNVAYITDFGLARIAETGESTLSQDVLLGTPHYISPEQAMGRRDLDARTDLYSLGVVLYELVVGRVPFSADTPYAIIHDHIYRALPLPSKVNPDIPAQVETVLLKALAKDPADRYQSAAEMVQAFTSAVQSAGMNTLNPNRASSAAVEIAKMRADDEDTVTPPKIPSPMPGLPRQPEPPDQSLSRRDRRRKRHDHHVDFQLDLGNVGDQVRQQFEHWEDSPLNPERWGEEDIPRDDEDSIRRRVEKQYKKRGEFVGHAAVYVMVNIVLWLVYGFVSGDIGGFLNLDGIAGAAVGFPWPLFVMFGWGSGLLAHGIETYFMTGERAAKAERAVRTELRSLYGDDWRNQINKREYNQIKRRVMQPYNKRREWYQHLGVYVMINIMLWLVYAMSSGFGSFLDDVAGAAVGFPWPLIVMFGWGIGLVAHGAETMASSGRHADAHERAIQREIERERAQLEDDSLLLEKPKNDFPVRLNDDGELTDSVVEAFEADKPKRRADKR